MYRCKRTTGTEGKNLLLFKQGVILLSGPPGVPLIDMNLVCDSFIAIQCFIDESTIIILRYGFGTPLAITQKFNLVCICLKVESAWIKHEHSFSVDKGSRPLSPLGQRFPFFRHWTLYTIPNRYTCHLHLKVIEFLKKGQISDWACKSLGKSWNQFDSEIALHTHWEKSHFGSLKRSKEKYLRTPSGGSIFSLSGEPIKWLLKKSRLNTSKGLFFGSLVGSNYIAMLLDRDCLALS